MIPVDRAIMNRRLEELEQALAYLESRKDISLKELLSDLELRYAVERALQLAIQSVLDVGAHILAAMSVNNVNTMADIPKRLAEKKIITAALSERLIPMARFRNILVHEYVTVDTKKLRGFLKDNLGDFRRFAREVTKALDL